MVGECGCWRPRRGTSSLRRDGGKAMRVDAESCSIVFAGAGPRSGLRDLCLVEGRAASASLSGDGEDCLDSCVTSMGDTAKIGGVRGQLHGRCRSSGWVAKRYADVFDTYEGKSDRVLAMRESVAWKS